MKTLRLTRVLLYAALLIGFGALVEYLVGWRSLLLPWLAINPLHVLLAVALVVATYVARALRIYRYFGARCDFPAWLRLMLQHNLLLNLLPMRTGELAFPVLMNQYFRIPVSRSLPGLFWLRILDMHSLLLMLLLAVMWLVSPIAALPMAFAWLAALPLLIYFAKEIPAILSRRTGRIGRMGRTAMAGVPPSAGQFLESWAWTALIWGLKLAVFGWIFAVFSATTHLNGVLAAIGGELSSIQPVQGIAGAGTYEAGAVAAAIPLGLPVSVAIQAAVNLHLFVLGVSILGALASLFGKVQVPEPSPLAS